ncbi:MAG: hypothetical protein AB1629_02140 [Candidatus Omnitrophota bacterium]
MKNRKRRCKETKFEADEHLADYLKTSYAQRLEWLAEINKFLNKITPLQSKRNWEELKRRGW